MDKELALSRQSELIPRSIADLTVLMIGLGGIGSNAAHVIASTGVEKLFLIDPDKVAEENVYPGWFQRKRIGKPKVKEVGKHLRREFDINPTMLKGELEEYPGLGWSDIVVISTDTLDSRRYAWFKRKDICRGWWIDARMGGTLCAVYTVPMNNQWARAEYSKHLRETEPAELPCGMKATAPLTKGIIAGFIGQSIYDIANGKDPAYIQRYDLRTKKQLAVLMQKENVDEQ